MNTRRKILFVLGAGTLAAPLASFAQQPRRIPRIGIVWIAARKDSGKFHESFLRGLRELGYVEGRNIVVEVGIAEGNVDRLPQLVADLLARQVEVIVAPSMPAARAAKAATDSVPIVMGNVANPESLGLVASLQKPGGNVTGLSSLGSDLSGKRLELLKEVLPRLTRLAVLWEPSTANLYRTEVESAARLLGLRLHPIEVHTIEEVENGFRSIARAGDEAVQLTGSGSGAFHAANYRRIAAAALKHRLPLICDETGYVEVGAMLSYGPDILDIFRRAAIYVDKILKGAKPADLPVEQPTKFVLAINMKTVKALGITIPPSILVRADRVIE